MTTKNRPVPTVTFAPGCFDDFTGTQEELDYLIEKLTEIVALGQGIYCSTDTDLPEMSELDIDSPIQPPRILQ